MRWGLSHRPPIPTTSPTPPRGSPIGLREQLSRRLGMLEPGFLGTRPSGSARLHRRLLRILLTPPFSHYYPAAPECACNILPKPPNLQKLSAIAQIAAGRFSSHHRGLQKRVLLPPGGRQRPVLLPPQGAPQTGSPPIPGGAESGFSSHPGGRQRPARPGCRTRCPGREPQERRGTLSCPFPASEILSTWSSSRS